MPRLIKGANLNQAQRRQVLSAYVHRLTTENGYPERNPCKARIKAISDTQWLRNHAFWFINSGARLTYTHRFAEPHYMAD